MGEAATKHAETFEWSASVRDFAGVLARSARESSRAAVRQDCAELVGKLERIQQGTGDLDGGTAAGVDVSAAGSAPSRKTAPSGLR
jgi:hypothetical protein